MLVADNASLVRSRLSREAAKRSTRLRTLEETRERNLRFKRLSHTDATTVADPEEQRQRLFAVKVTVCEKLRSELSLNGREKRGRVFVATDDDAVSFAAGLRVRLHEFFRRLKKDTYLLYAALPKEVSPDGNVISPSLSESDDKEVEAAFLKEHDFWLVDSDDAVSETFRKASEYYQQQLPGTLKRPSLLLHLSPNPDAPKPLPPPAYLEGMPDPADTQTMTMLSFYAFPNPPITDPEAFGETLRKLWTKPFAALGRVYVAREGVNAQMAVPTNVLPNFMECCRSVPELGEFMENGVNVDPIPLTMEEFRTAGKTMGEGEEPSPPFKALHVRVRAQIVSDGLSAPLDWQSAGYDMPPEEWHNTLLEAKKESESSSENDKKDVPLIFDCRNKYETVVGKFDLAEPLETQTFRDTWAELEERLKDTPKDAPIMTYCTGGIRCVKVGAYLTQKLNFTNVSRLAGGIIAYDRTLNDVEDGGTETKENDESKESLFKGTNYVFDGRVGRRITEDALGECVTCGVKTHLVDNCRNPSCHRRMVQCAKCRTEWLGTCSEACRQRVETARSRPSPLSGVETDVERRRVVDVRTKDDYVEEYSSPVPALLREIETVTAELFPEGSHMVSGAVQGRLLTTLASLTRRGRILEAGTFTGYATTCLWNGVANRAGGSVTTLERDVLAVETAARHLDLLTTKGDGEDAVRALREETEELGVQRDDLVLGEPIVFRRNDSECRLVYVPDALGTMDQMVAGTGPLHHLAPFDLIFLDAEKSRLLEYVEASLSLLADGGLIVVDNVLWKGMVLGTANGGVAGQPPPSSEDVVGDADDREERVERKRSRRARRIAGIMHRFNEAIREDDRLEVTMLPIRDGLSLIRRK